MDEKTILSKFDALVAAGDVIYDDEQRVVEHVEGGLKFQFCISPALDSKPKKPSDSNEEKDDNSNKDDSDSDSDARPRPGSDIATTGYELSSVGPTHFLTANKFCFARPHLMLLTSSGYQRQFTALTESDLGAAKAVLDGLGKGYIVFFNGGKRGGCSRLHKHLQAMPLPDGTFARIFDEESGVKGGDEIPYLYFLHRYDEAVEVTAEELKRIYDDLLSQATKVYENEEKEVQHKEDQDQNGEEPNGEEKEQEAVIPHNMLMTSKWIVVIPRRKAGVLETEGVNAIGMLGYIAVSKAERVDKYKEIGMKKAFGQLGVPK